MGRHLECVCGVVCWSQSSPPGRELVPAISLARHWRDVALLTLSTTTTTATTSTESAAASTATTTTPAQASPPIDMHRSPLPPPPLLHSRFAITRLRPERPNVNSDTLTSRADIYTRKSKTTLRFTIRSQLSDVILTRTTIPTFSIRRPLTSKFTTFLDRICACNFK